MRFSAEDKIAMLNIKGVGRRVIVRLEQLGFSSLLQLAETNAADITRTIGQTMGANCWQNSPQARNAIQAIVDLAKQKSTIAIAVS